jgi:hypothetical protein
MTISDDDLDLALTAFAARMALLMAAGDESGIHSLARVFAGPELVDELVDLARELVAVFELQTPGVLRSMLAAHEQALGGQLDDDDAE